MENGKLQKTIFGLQHTLRSNLLLTIKIINCLQITIFAFEFVEKNNLKTLFLLLFSKNNVMCVGGCVCF